MTNGVRRAGRRVSPGCRIQTRLSLGNPGILDDCAQVGSAMQRISPPIILAAFPLAVAHALECCPGRVMIRVVDCEMCCSKF